MAGMMGGMMGYGYGMYGLGLGWLFQLLIFAAFILVIWWILKKGARGQEGSADDILKKRLARGELTKRQYEELKAEIAK